MLVNTLVSKHNHTIKPESIGFDSPKERKQCRGDFRYGFSHSRACSVLQSLHTTAATKRFELEVLLQKDNNHTETHHRAVF